MPRHKKNLQKIFQEERGRLFLEEALKREAEKDEKTKREAEIQELKDIAKWQQDQITRESSQQRRKDRRKRWVDRYLDLEVRDPILYIESGTDSTNFEDKPFKHVYCGEIIRVNKIRVVFRIFKYRDDILFSNPWVVAGEYSLLWKEIESPHTDTKLIPEIFVKHLKYRTSPVDYWELVQRTFELAHKKWIFQRSLCRYGKMCPDNKVGHLINWKH